MSYNHSGFNNSISDEERRRGQRYPTSNSGQWPTQPSASGPSWNPAQPTFPTAGMSSGYYPGSMASGPGYPMNADFHSQPQYHSNPAPGPYLGYQSPYIDPLINQPPSHAPQTRYNLPMGTQHSRNSGFADSSSNPSHMQPSTQWPTGPYSASQHPASFSGPRNSMMPSSSGPRSHSRHGHSPSYPNAQIQLPGPDEHDYAADNSGDGKECSHCHTTSTPLWRRDPRTHKVLCNACGLYLYQRNELRPQKLITLDTEDNEVADSDGEYDGPECANCGTRKTSTWRRNKAGMQVCNACGVFERMNGKPRPLALRNDKIRPRSKH
ncbi:hypothetical protein FB451DRAFT_1144504 [Mycena latifolia]|nr:hypothetical protein FB451DRAFT_1144504 [Mycena latifolia]